MTDLFALAHHDQEVQGPPDEQHDHAEPDRIAKAADDEGKSA